MRLIDVDAINDFYIDFDSYKEGPDDDDVKAWLNEQPTIEAEVVVRCEDCEAFYPKDKNFLQHCTRTGLVVHKNDFCSGGERREKNEHDIINGR